jgi:outer membrane immunogenic protein
MLKAIFSTVTFLAASPALASGYPAPTPEQPTITPVALTPTTDWTGGYIGGQTDSLRNGRDRGFGSDNDFDGTLFGIFGGYRYDLGNIVIGAEVDYLTGSGDFDRIDGSLSFDIDYDILRVGVEVGFDAGPALIYGTAGYAQLDISTSFGDFDGDGFFYGLGMDYRVSDSITVGGEILQHVWDDFAVPTNDLSATTLGLNLAFTF